MAKTFKTAEQLGLEEKHYCALVKTLVELESGRIEHLRDPSLDSGDGRSKVSRFNMGVWRSATYDGCGTVCCIGGSAEIIGRLPMYSMLHLEATGSNGLHELFYPYETGSDDWGCITPKQATRALRNYLTYGEPRWKKAMKEQ